MKILIINHYASPPSLGMSGRHHALAKQLVSYGHEVLILASASHPYLNVSYQLTKPLQIIEEEHIKYLLLPSHDYQGNGVGRLLNMLSFLWEAINIFKNQKLFTPDVVIGSSVHPFAALAGERIAKQYDVPFCFEVRDFWPQTLIDMGVLSKRHPLSILFYRMEKYLYRKAEKIIVLLPYGYEYICNLGISKEKIVYIPNGIDLDIFSDIKKPQEDKIENFLVMYLGSFGPANNLDVLLEAAFVIQQETYIPKINWYLIGSGPGKESLKQKAKEMKLDNFFIQDKVPKSHVPRLLMKADAVIFHLRQVDVFKYGISPNKLFDYLASFRPIIYACNARNNPVIEAQAGISIPPEDPKAMAKAITQLASMSLEDRNKMGQSGRLYVEKNHDYKSLGKILNHLLKEIVMSPKL